MVYQEAALGEEISILSRYDLTADAIRDRLIGLVMEFDEPLNPQNIFRLGIRGDRRFQEMMSGLKLATLPVIFARRPGQEVRDNIVNAEVLSRAEKRPDYGKAAEVRIDTIGLDIGHLLGVNYCKIYLPKPEKLSPELSYAVMFPNNFLPNTSAHLVNDRISLGSMNRKGEGFGLEGVMVLAATRSIEGDEMVYISGVELPKGWERFFYRSGSMFTRNEVQKLQDVLVRPEQLSYAPTAKELELVSTLESYPQAALEGIKEKVGKYPDPASLKVCRGEKVACFGRDDMPNVRMGIGTRDKLTVILAGLDVRQLAQLVSKGEFHFSALDKCLSDNGRDSLLLQVSAPEPGEIAFQAAVVRPVEGENKYTDSLARSRALIEGFQSNCPGFSVDVLRKRVSNEFGKRSAFAYIISQLQPFEEKLLSQRAEQRR